MRTSNQAGCTLAESEGACDHRKTLADGQGRFAILPSAQTFPYLTQPTTALLFGPDVDCIRLCGSLMVRHSMRSGWI